MSNNIQFSLYNIKKVLIILIRIYFSIFIQQED